MKNTIVRYGFRISNGAGKPGTRLPRPAPIKSIATLNLSILAIAILTKNWLINISNAKQKKSSSFIKPGQESILGPKKPSKFTWPWATRLIK